MIVDITPLNYGKDIYIDEIINFTKEDLKNTEIINLNNIEVKGYIKREMEELLINLKIKGTMILPCSISLEPTDYDFETEITQIIEEKDEKIKKTIDILPIIWENILMEIPIKIVNPKYSNIKLEGNGWELITDSEN